MHADTITHDTLNIDLIRRELDPGPVGSRIHLYDEIPSTNEVLKGGR
jgi:hypothetical protein